MRSSIVFVISFLIGLASSLGNLGAFPARAQLSPFPNELPGYEFFGKGKLLPVEFGKTKREDIERIFGGTCEKSCDYDERFTIQFDYLSCDDCMTTEYVRDRFMCPLNEYMSTIEKITISPRIPVKFDMFPTSRFPNRTGGAVWSKDGSGGVSYESFGDDSGLKYSIKQSSTATLTLVSPAPKVMNGELYSIEYGLSTELETKIFNAEYESCKKQTQAN
ncbi:hypothetical protein BH24ACI3_BH24ACI3_13610 [soil metagenome]